MKALHFLPIFMHVITMLEGQTQLDIQGVSASPDTVVKIRVNYTMPTNVVGLSVHSSPTGGSGIGGHFYGGKTGIQSYSDSGTAVSATSKSGAAVGAYSESNYAVFAISGFDDAVHAFSTSGYGVSGQSTHSYGVYGQSSNSYGVYGQSNINIGVRGESTSSYGVYGQSSSSYGVYGSSTSDAGVLGASTNGVGVYAYSVNSVGVVGKGQVACFDAQGPGMGYAETSSKRWKRKVMNIPDPLTKLQNLRGVYFHWDKDHGGRHDIGFIAEEIGEILPEIVAYEENGIDASSMEYSKLTPLLVEAANAMRREYQEELKKQKQEIQELRAELARIQTILSGLTGTN